MEDLIRLLIANKRLVNNKTNNFELTKEEAHYINKVMRIKTGKEIFVTNGERDHYGKLKKLLMNL